MKVNRSLIAKGTGIKYENGRMVLDLDPVEGIDTNDKDFFDSTNSESVGNVLVGMSDEQIRLAMKTPFVDYIIPFHTGLKKDILKAKKIDHWDNYKNFQTDKDISTGKVAKNQINVYVDVIQAAEAEGKPIKNKVDFVNKFLAVAKEKGLKPRFWNFLDVDANGEYTYTEGYHKFLVDFKLFDQQGNILPQKPVVPRFDDALNARILNEYVEGKRSPAPRDAVYDHLEREVINEGVKKSVRKIVGPSGTDYGLGVYLDSTLLDNLTDNERIVMIKEYVKELGGSVFTAYDQGGNAVDVHIVEAGKKFKNKNGKRIPVNKDMTSYLKTVKQEAIALVDELITTSTYGEEKPSNYPHGWLDGNGKNNWEYWTVYLQEKNNSVWEATLNIANSTNGEKILYDIVPIKMVEGAVTSATPTTKGSLAHTEPNVKDKKFSRRDSEGRELTDAQQEFFKDSKVRDADGNLMPVYHGTPTRPLAAAGSLCRSCVSLPQLENGAVRPFSHHSARGLSWPTEYG